MNWNDLMQKSRVLGEIGLSDALGLPWEGHGMAYCPAHEDRSKSLSWRWSNGKLLLHCFAGCTFEQIRASVR